MMGMAVILRSRIVGREGLVVLHTLKLGSGPLDFLQGCLFLVNFVLDLLDTQVRSINDKPRDHEHRTSIDQKTTFVRREL